MWSHVLSYVRYTELLTRYLNSFKTLFALIFFIIFPNFGIHQSSRYYFVLTLFLCSSPSTNFVFDILYFFRYFL
jgi:hypothetical protein